VSAEKNKRKTDQASADREIARRKKVLEGNIEALKMQFESISEKLNNLDDLEPQKSFRKDALSNGHGVTDTLKKMK
jgi:archaellum component FlaC